jgi:hypothetical protein
MDRATGDGRSGRHTVCSCCGPIISKAAPKARPRSASSEAKRWPRGKAPGGKDCVAPAPPPVDSYALFPVRFNLLGCRCPDCVATHQSRELNILALWLVRRVDVSTELTSFRAPIFAGDFFLETDYESKFAISRYPGCYLHHRLN